MGMKKSATKKFYRWHGNAENGFSCQRSGYSIVPYGFNDRNESIYDILNAEGYSVTGEANVLVGLKQTANRDHAC